MLGQQQPLTLQVPLEMPTAPTPPFHHGPLEATQTRMRKWLRESRPGNCPYPRPPSPTCRPRDTFTQGASGSCTLLPTCPHCVPSMQGPGWTERAGAHSPQVTAPSRLAALESQGLNLSHGGRVDGTPELVLRPAMVLTMETQNHQHSDSSKLRPSNLSNPGFVFPFRLSFTFYFF